MIKEIPITEARHELTSLPRMLKKDPSAIPVTRRGKRVLAILSWDLYESIVETLDIMSDPTLVKALRQGIKQLQEGKGIPWEKAKRQLGF